MRSKKKKKIYLDFLHMSQLLHPQALSAAKAKAAVHQLIPQNPQTLRSPRRNSSANTPKTAALIFPHFPHVPILHHLDVL
jgi:hypothetical protein